jgi:hypothetical protein
VHFSAEKAQSVTAESEPLKFLWTFGELSLESPESEFLIFDWVCLECDLKQICVSAEGSRLLVFQSSLHSFLAIEAAAFDFRQSELRYWRPFICMLTALIRATGDRLSPLEEDLAIEQCDSEPNLRSLSRLSCTLLHFSERSLSGLEHDWTDPDEGKVPFTSPLFRRFSGMFSVIIDRLGCRVPSQVPRSAEQHQFCKDLRDLLHSSEFSE